jgi:hypothetical protein
MGNGIKHTILFLAVITSFFISLAYAEGCGGACVVSGGGSSYNFMGDPAFNMDMSNFDEFIRDNLGNNQTTLHKRSLTRETLSNANSSLNQTCNRNASQNASELCNVVNSLGYTTLNNRTVKLGASNMQDQRLSTLASLTSNNFMF